MVKVRQNNLDLMFTNDYAEVNFAAGSCSCSCSSAASIVEED
ncbi:hypothetical protein ACOAKC_08545 [Hathewaya histolytica]